MESTGTDANPFVVLVGLGMTIMVFIGLGLHVAFFYTLLQKQTVFRERLQLLSERPWVGRDVVQVVLMTLLILFLGGALFSFSKNGVSEALLLLFSSLLLVVWLFARIYGLMRQKEVSWVQAFGGQGHLGSCLGWGIGFYVASFPLVLFCSWLNQSILHALDIPFQVQAIFDFLLEEDVSLWEYGCVFFAAVICAPFIEELVFRGVLLPVFTRAFSVIWSLILVSAIFSLIHFSYSVFLPIMAIGFYMGLAYVFTGHILTAMIVHFFFNTVNLCLFLFVMR